MALVVHPNLVAGPHGPCVTINRSGKLRPIYLQQSVLDQACGPHCVYMAMMILKLVSRSQLLIMSRGDDEYHPLFNSWLMAQSYWLHGTPTRGLLRLFAGLEDKITLTAIDETSTKVNQYLASNYQAHDVYIINIFNWRANLDHWLLVVGQKIEADGSTSWLTIDPYTPPLGNQLFSGKLKTTKGKISSYHMNNGKVWQAKASALLRIQLEHD